MWQKHPTCGIWGLFQRVTLKHFVLHGPHISQAVTFFSQTKRKFRSSFTSSPPGSIHKIFFFPLLITFCFLFSPSRSFHILKHKSKTMKELLNFYKGLKHLRFKLSCILQSPTNFRNSAITLKLYYSSQKKNFLILYSLNKKNLYCVVRAFRDSKADIQGYRKTLWYVRRKKKKKQLSLLYSEILQATLFKNLSERQHRPTQMQLVLAGRHSGSVRV